MRDDIPILPLYTDYTCYKVNWSRARVVIYVFRLSSILRMYSHTYIALDDPVTRFHARSSIKRLTYEMVFKLCGGGGRAVVLCSYRHFESSLYPPSTPRQSFEFPAFFRPVNGGSETMRREEESRAKIVLRLTIVRLLPTIWTIGPIEGTGRVSLQDWRVQWSSLSRLLFAVRLC